jgi:hypothetical protein
LVISGFTPLLTMSSFLRCLFIFFFYSSSLLSSCPLPLTWIVRSSLPLVFRTTEVNSCLHQ